MGLARRHMALLHIAKKQLGLDDETYRDVLSVQAGVESAKDLDIAGFARVMGRFEELGFRSKRPNRRPADDDLDIANAITERQQGYIQWLFSRVGMTSTRQQTGFCRRQLDGQLWPQSRDDARVIIESLKKMVARGYRAGAPGGQAAKEE